MSLHENVIIDLQGLCCTRAVANEPVSFVSDVSLSIEEKTLLLLSGSEQSGRNLLLRLVGLLDVPDQGDVLFRGCKTRLLADDERAELRTRQFGFLFAQPYLLPSFSIIENVAMPLFKISGVGPEEARKRTEAILGFTGTDNLSDTPVEQLTLPQQHRVSLARALVNEPQVLIVEDVGTEMSGEERLDFIQIVYRTVSELGITTIVSSNEVEFTALADRTIELAGGGICRDSDDVLKNGGAAV